MKRITNVDELRAELLRLKQQKKEQEVVLKQHVDDLSNKFKPVLGVLDFFGVVDTDGKDDSRSAVSLGKIALKKGLEYGLPFLMNRPFFRSRVKAGISSEENTSELQSLMRIPSAILCLENKNTLNNFQTSNNKHGLTP